MGGGRENNVAIIWKRWGHYILDYLWFLFTVQYTGAQEQNIMKVPVRKKVSILLKAPEAPLLKYVN